MAHSSDLTYLSRAVFICWTFLWFLQHVWNIDRFEALKWGRVKKHDLKSAITVLLVIMCPLQAFYDISTSVIKYQEGFMVNPLNGEIITKPNEFWSKRNQELLVPTDYVLCANFSLQTCLLFLLQSFWNYLAKNLAKTSFMGSFEFKSYIIYAIFSVFIFPSLQYFFRYDPLYTEIMPQLAYSIFMFLIALFGLRSHKRFTNLLLITRKSSASQINIILKLEYFRDMNRYLTWSLFIGSISLLILCIDGLTPEKYLNTEKFPADLLMCHVSFSLWLVFVTLMLIFYPSSNTVSDSVALAKGGSFPGIAKRSLKNEILEPPTPHWLNADESQWSSQASTQQSNSQIDNNNSYSIEVYDELPPPPVIVSERKSNSLDIPLTPPSPYRPYTSIPSITAPPPPPIPLQPILPQTIPPQPIPPQTTMMNPPKIQQKSTPLISYAAQLTQSTQSTTSPIKQSNQLEKLKYPSSPIISRNNSFDKINDYVNNDNGSLNNSSIYPQLSSANVPILSPLPRKSFVGSLFDSSVIPSPPMKSSRRTSVSSNDTSPVIRITTSTTSLRSVYSVALPSSDEDDRKEPSTINKITNLDTRKVAPFMYQDEPVKQETPILRSPPPNNTVKKTMKTGEKQGESKKEQSPPNVPTEVSIQQSSNLQQNSNSANNKDNSSNNDNNNNGASSPSTKASTSKSSSTPNTSRPPLTSKAKITSKPYQSSPLSKSGSKMNEIASSSTTTSTSSTVKKSSPAQINNLKNPKVINSGAGGAANNVRNNAVRNSIIRSRSNSTASVGSGKMSSDSTTDNEKKSERNIVKNSVNSVRNSIIGGRTRSNSTASVGAKNSVAERKRSESTSSSIRNSVIGKVAGRNRSSSSASSSSVSSASSISSTSSTSSSGSIKKVIKTGVGKVRRGSKIS